MRNFIKKIIYIFNLLKYPFSSDARKFVKEYQENQLVSNTKLIMTLVVRNEQEVIERHIRFHAAMGVDGFIVTSHKSTDRTNTILKKLQKEGLVLDILCKDSPNHQHSVWVNDMIKLAKYKYKADWVINSDADEFYYSKDLNLKKSIISYKEVNPNVLIIDSTFVFPNEESDFLSSPYFVVKPFQEFEVRQLNLLQDKRFEEFTGSQGCTKVIHKTKGFKRITDGNHSIIMHRKKQLCIASNIVLYHFHIRNYKGYEEKVLRWIDSAQYMPKGQGEHMKHMIELYKQGKLRNNYDSLFGDEMRSFLLAQGVVAIDKSVANFIRWKGIINKYD